MSGPGGRRPNVLWICTDQQRADTVRALGNAAIRTPTLDRLVGEGVAFTRAYCQSPVCTPSRASFLAGRYPSHLRANRNGASSPPAATTVVRRLADEGYACGLIGKLHLATARFGMERRGNDGYRSVRYSSDPWQPATAGNDYAAWLRRRGLARADVFARTPDGAFRGYLPNVDPAVHQSTWCADEAIAFVESAAEQGDPWLLSVNMFDPHPPFDAPSAYARPYFDAELPTPIHGPEDADVQRRLAPVFFQSDYAPPGDEAHPRTASYYGMITLADEQIGRIVDSLENTGQRENTLIVVMSDHGEMLGDHGLVLKGCRFYEGLTRVPLVLSWPGVVREGAASDDLVELADVAPTIAEACGVDLPEAQGRSLLPAMTEGRPHDRGHVRCEYIDAIVPDAPRRAEGRTRSVATMYRDDRYKLIVYHRHGTGELYDLQADPDERHDLWLLPEAQELRLELLHRSFDAAMAALDDGPPAVAPA